MPFRARAVVSKLQGLKLRTMLGLPTQSSTPPKK